VRIPALARQRWRARIDFRGDDVKDPIVLRRHDTISLAEASYWKDLLYRVIKIGTELEVAPPKGSNRPSFEAAVCDALVPSGNLELLGVNGVLDVSPEHCGIEIRVIGRQPHFSALHHQYASIIERLLASGARTRPTCGLHFHILTPGLAEPVPEIILANIWNLTRRYAPELRFLTSGGDLRQALCRRRNYTSHLEMVRHSPATMSMAEIQQALKESPVVPEHQNFLNLEHIRFTENCAVTAGRCLPVGRSSPASSAVLPFHLEFRFPDADLSPTAITAKTFLLLAMALKAVDLSQYGVIHVGKIIPWKRKIELLNLLSNNDGDLATSDTSGVTDAVIEELRQGCYELLDLLAPTFEQFDHNPSFDVLMTLAEQPVSLLRCAGYSWREIESLLARRATLDEVGVDDTDRRLMQRIELGEWIGQPSAAAWQWQATHELFLTPQELEQRLGKLQVLRGLRWDARRGTMVLGS
jgi:hypothetical protein